MNQVLQGDCLELLKTLPDNSVGMFLCDLPYGCTACHWDKRIELDALWEQVRRLLQPKRAAVFTATQPFTTDLINSNREWFKYCWAWDKDNSAGFALTKKRPFIVVEDVIVFGEGQTKYNPQKETRGKPRSKGGYGKSSAYGITPVTNKNNEYYPKNIIRFSNACQLGKINSTQKPVALFEYLIRTYTNPGDTVVDPTAGSMTTAIAAMNTGRGYICMEKDPEEYRKGLQRVEEYLSAPRQISLLEPEPQPLTQAAPDPNPQLALFPDAS